MIDLSFDFKAFAGALAFLAICRYAFNLCNKLSPPAILHPEAKDLLKAPKSLLSKFSDLPRRLEWAALALFLIAFTDPHFFTQDDDSRQAQERAAPTEGIAIYLLADESGSMMEEVTTSLPSGSRATLKKIELLKQVTESFVKNRPNDLIGLVSFARGAQIRSPLTLDHQAVIDQLQNLKPSIREEDGGTAIGYALYKTSNLILATKHFAKELIDKGKPAYTIKHSVIVLLTDGVQNSNPLDRDNPLRTMDLPQAALFAKMNGIRFYTINLDPSIASDEWAPQRRQMIRATESTGGSFYVVDSAHSLDSIFKEIDRIEKSRIPSIALSKENMPELYQRVSLYPYFIACGLITLFLGLFLNATLLRRVP